MRFLSVAIVLAGVAASSSVADERRNYFDDPFVQLTHGIADCPAPEGPLMTEAGSRIEAHVRSERGTRCYLEGRCRLPNSYQYDKGIMALVQKSVTGDPRWKDTSVWALGQRRWVYLKGCVRTKQKADDLERWVKGVDDVDRVINELRIGK